MSLKTLLEVAVDRTNRASDHLAQIIREYWDQLQPDGCTCNPGLPLPSETVLPPCQIHTGEAPVAPEG